MPQGSVLIGVGNPFVSDDAIGVIVAQRLAARLHDFDIEIACSGGFELVDRMLGYRFAAVVDAMLTGAFPIGTVRRVDLGKSDCLIHLSSHGVTMDQAIEFAQQVGAPIPEQIIIYGIEIGRLPGIGEGISFQLEQSIDSIVEEIEKDLSGRGSSCMS